MGSTPDGTDQLRNSMYGGRSRHSGRARHANGGFTQQFSSTPPGASRQQSARRQSGRAMPPGLSPQAPGTGQPDASTPPGGSTHQSGSSKQSPGTKQRFPRYLAHGDVGKGLKQGSLIRASIRVNIQECSQAFATVPGLPSDLMIRVRHLPFVRPLIAPCRSTDLACQVLLHRQGVWPRDSLSQPLSCSSACLLILESWRLETRFAQKDVCPFTGFCLQGDVRLVPHDLVLQAGLPFI